MPRVPVISLHELSGNRDKLGELDRACREWGFFQLVDHGLDSGRLDVVHQQMRRFFSLPGEDKRRIERSAENAWGFFDRELTKNRLDWKQIFDFGPAERPAEGPAGGPAGSSAALAGSHPQWPEGLPGFQAEMEAWYEDCEAVSFRLLEGIALNLGLPAGGLEKAFRPDGTSFLRLNYYPRCARPAPADMPAGGDAGELGIHHHTDAGALTILLQDAQPGLQVLHEGRWQLVEPMPGALTVNVGDVVQVWSNDRYRAPLHRVLASAESSRYSAAFFFNPSYATDYAPIGSCLDPGEPIRYRPINWGQFRSGRAAGDYADYGEEIQIEHFRVQ